MCATLLPSHAWMTREGTIFFLFFFFFGRISFSFSWTKSYLIRILYVLKLIIHEYYILNKMEKIYSYFHFYIITPKVMKTYFDDIALISTLLKYVLNKNNSINRKYERNLSIYFTFHIG